jgi:hypothetical protein
MGYSSRAQAHFLCIEPVFRGLKASAPSVKNLEEATWIVAGSGRFGFVLSQV